MTVFYKKRRSYKYKVFADYEFQTDIIPVKANQHGFLRIDGSGLITAKAGYTWDGPSGPAIDTKNFMRGSLIHDALYQLMREERVGPEYRKRADQILREVCREDGMSRIRATWVYWGVRIGSGPHSKPNLLTAP